MNIFAQLRFVDTQFFQFVMDIFFKRSISLDIMTKFIDFLQPSEVCLRFEKILQTIFIRNPNVLDKKREMFHIINCVIIVVFVDLGAHIFTCNLNYLTQIIAGNNIQQLAAFACMFSQREPIFSSANRQTIPPNNRCLV